MGFNYNKFKKDIENNDVKFLNESYSPEIQKIINSRNKKAENNNVTISTPIKNNNDRINRMSETNSRLNKFQDATRKEVQEQAVPTTFLKNPSTATVQNHSPLDFLGGIAQDVKNSANNLGLGLANGVLGFQKQLNDQMIVTQEREQKLFNKTNQDLIEKIHGIQIDPTSTYSSFLQQKIINNLNDKNQNISNVQNKNLEKIQANIQNSTNPISRKVAELAPSIGQMLPGFIPGAGPVYFAGSAASQYTDEGLQRGMTKDEARNYGGVMGLVEGATETLGAWLTKGVGKALAKGNISKALKTYGLDIAENFVEEAIIEPISEVTATITGGKDTADFSNMGSRMLQSGIDGALISIILGGASAGVGSAINVVEKMNSNIEVTNVEIQQAVIDTQASGKVDIENEIRGSILAVKDKIITQPNEQLPVINEKLKVNKVETKPTTVEKAPTATAPSELVRGINKITENNIELDVDNLPTARAQIQGNKVTIDYERGRLEDIIHEISHYAENNENGYKVLSDFVLTELKKQEDFEQIKDEVNELYSKEYEKEGRVFTESELENELVAKYTERFIGDEIFVNKIVNANKSTAQRIYEWIKNKINYYKKVAKMEPEQRLEYENLRKAEKLWEKALKGVKEFDKNLNKEVIETNSKGYKYVKADRQVISGDDPKSWQNQTERYINQKIRNGQDVNVVTDSGDILTITKDTAGKAKFRNEILQPDGTKIPISDKELLAKLTAETHIDELAKISNKINTQPVPDTKNHKFAKDGFDYRRAYFEDFDGQYYRITMSVGKNGSIDTIYNIGRMDNQSKKNRSNSSITAQRPLSQKANSEDYTSTNSISQKSKTVNNKSMQKEVNNTAMTAKDKTLPTSNRRIEDFGEKIGGARKDIATTKGITKEVKNVIHDYTVEKFDNEFFVKFKGKVLKEGFKSQAEAERYILDFKDSIKSNLAFVEEGTNREGEKRYIIKLRNARTLKTEYTGKIFSDKQEAESYAIALSIYLKEHGKNLFRPTIQKVTRINPDVSNAAETIGETILTKFGFRGGEFGNWVNQKERQEFLNYANDAFIDLASALEISPEDLGQNKTMGIAFGARGQGLSSAVAHFEPIKKVINMTRLKGAGSLAHEYGHSLDNFISRVSGYDADGFVTTNSRSGNLSEQMKKAINDIKDAINYSVSTNQEEIEKKNNIYEKGRLESLKSHLSYMNRVFAGEAKTYQYNRKTKQREQVIIETTEAQKQEYNRIKNILEKGELENKREYKIANLNKTDVEYAEPLESLKKLYKDVIGRKMDEDTVYWLYRYGIKAKQVTEIKSESAFSKSAIELDRETGRKSAYFSKMEEKWARAFEAYIYDKLKEKGITNTYLVHSVNNSDYALFNPFPAGEERQKINKAFDKLIAIMKEEGIFSENKQKIVNNTAPTAKDTQAPKYSIGGTIGMNNAIKSDARNIALEKMYNQAQQMKKNGVDNETIRKQTDWFQDKNGDWKFEFTDKYMSLKSNIELKPNRVYKLEHILKHDTLFMVYPQLKEYKVIITDMKANGSFNKNINRIKLNKKILNDEASIEGTLIHEIQHAIQHIEGFEAGKQASKSRLAYYNSLGEIEATDIKNRFYAEKYYNKRLNNIAPESSKANPKHQNLDNYLKNRGIIDKIKDGVYNYFKIKDNKGAENDDYTFNKESKRQDSEKISENVFQSRGENVRKAWNRLGLETRGRVEKGIADYEDDFKENLFENSRKNNDLADGGERGRYVNEELENSSSFSMDNTNPTADSDIRYSLDANQKKKYMEYKNDESDYNDKVVDKALGIVRPNAQGRRTKEQWLYVAEYIGKELDGLSETEVEKIAYRSWFDLAPNRKEQLNRQGKNFVPFEITEWVNKVLENYKKVRTVADNGEVYTLERFYNENANNFNDIKEAEMLFDEFYNMQIKKSNVSSKISDSSEIVTENGNVRKFYENVRTSRVISDEIRNSLKPKIYRKLTNDESMVTAIAKLNNNPEEEAKWRKRDITKTNSVDVAEGLALLAKYQHERKYESALEVIDRLAEIGTKGGQQIQMFALLQRLTPEGMLNYAQKSLNKALEEEAKYKNQQWIDEHQEEYKLTKEDAEFITERMEKVVGMEDGRDKQILLAEIQKRISEKLPPDRGASIKAYMRISMLFNTKTQIRNILGNALISPVNVVADTFATTIDKMVAKKTGVRTKGLTDVKSVVEGTVTGIYKSIDDFKRGIDTRNVESDRFEIGSGVRGSNFSNKTRLGRAINSLDRTLSFMLDMGDRPFYESAFLNSINNQMKLNNVTIPTPEMIEIATKEALQRTWQDNNAYTTAVLKIRDILNGKVTKNSNGFRYGLGDLLIPFAKTPANLTKAIVDYSPVGFIKTLAKDGKQLSNAISKNEDVQKYQHQFVDNLGKGFAGSLIYILGWALANAGIVTGENDEDKDVANFMKNTLGIQPYSIKIGNQSFTYDWAQPIAVPVAIMSNYVKYSKDNPDATAITKALKASIIGSEQLFEQSFMSSINNILNGYNESIFENILDEALALPARGVPTLLKQIADMIDGTQRTSFDKTDKLATVGNKVIAKLPVASTVLAPSVDTMGREIQKYGGDNNMFNVFFNPANTNKGQLTESAEEIYNLYKETGDKTIFPIQAPYSVTMGGETTALDTYTRAEYQKTTGKYSDDTVKSLLTSSDYKGLSDEEKVEVLKNVVTDSNLTAKKEVLNYVTDNKTQKEKSKETGISLPNMYIYSNIINAMESKKDSKGESIKGSRQASMAQYIMAMKTTETQKNRMLAEMSDGDRKTTVDDLETVGLKNYTQFWGIGNANSKEKYKRLVSTGMNTNQLNKYWNEINDIEGEKDKNGNTISGSKKKAVVEYINNLSLSTGEKLLLYASTSNYTLTYSEKSYLLNYIYSLSGMNNKEKEELIDSLKCFDK